MARGLRNEEQGIRHAYAQRGLSNELNERGVGKLEKKSGQWYLGVRIRVAPDDPHRQAEQADAEATLRGVAEDAGEVVFEWSEDNDPLSPAWKPN